MRNISNSARLFAKIAEGSTTIEDVRRLAKNRGYTELVQFMNKAETAANGGSLSSSYIGEVELLLQLANTVENFFLERLIQEGQETRDPGGFLFARAMRVQNQLDCMKDYV